MRLVLERLSPGSWPLMKELDEFGPLFGRQCRQERQRRRQQFALKAAARLPRFVEQPPLSLRPHRVWRVRTRRRSSAARSPRASAACACARSRSSARRPAFCCGSSASSAPIRCSRSAGLAGGAGAWKRVHSAPATKHKLSTRDNVNATHKRGRRAAPRAAVEANVTSAQPRRDRAESRSQGRAARAGNWLRAEGSGPLSVRDASLPMAKPSQLAIAIAAARLPHWAKPCDDTPLPRRRSKSETRASRARRARARRPAR